MLVSGVVEGKVQNIMFRQTFIRGLINRGLRGGATNLDNIKRVSFTIEGNDNLIKEVIDNLSSSEVLNSWGAKVEKLFISDKVIPIQDHQVTTDNVDDHNWRQDVDFYF